MDYPKVSVIIPTYNGAEYICESIDSVLTQTYKNFEIIVVDDGSIDNTKEVLGKYGQRIKYIYQENQGVAAARNRGVREARGEYLAFLDQDDIWKPHKLLKQINIIESNSQLGLVCSLMETIDEKGNLLNQIKPKIPPGNNFEEALFRGSSYPSTYLIRKSCFEDVGLFDESIAVYDDIDLYLRIALRYLIEISDEPLVYWRLHSSNTGKNDMKAYENQIIFSKKWLSFPLKNKQKIFLIDKIKKYSFLLVKQFLKKGRILTSLRHFFVFGIFSIKAIVLSKKESDKFQILFVESGFGFGGSAKSLSLLLKYIGQQNFKPSILYYNFGPTIEGIQNTGVPTGRCSFLKLLFSISRFDLIYINNELYSHFWNIVLSQIFRKRCICHIRGIRPLTRREKFVAGFVDKFIAVSNTCRDNLFREGIPEEKIEIIYDGVEISDSIPVSSLREVLRVGVVSRIDPQKGHSVFVEAASLLADEKNLEYLIFGDDTNKDKPVLRELRRMVESRSLNSRIHFMGWEKDIKKIYEHIDIAVCPSELNESFGMNVAEAMSYGKPVVVSSTGAYVELIQDGVNGLLFQPGNASDLAQKVEFLINDAALRERLSLEAYKTAKEKFDIKMNVVKIEKLIEDVLLTKVRSRPVDTKGK